MRGRQADLEKQLRAVPRHYPTGQCRLSLGAVILVPGDYIKQVAQSAGMGTQLFALCVNRGKWTRFPTAHLTRTSPQLVAPKPHSQSRWDDWLAADLIPMEPIPEGYQRPASKHVYGMDRWYKLFAPRQLLAMLTYLESLGELVPEMERDLGKERAAAVRTYLAVVLDKCANWNSSILACGTLPRNRLRTCSTDTISP